MPRTPLAAAAVAPAAVAVAATRVRRTTCGQALSPPVEEHKASPVLDPSLVLLVSNERVQVAYAILPALQLVSPIKKTGICGYSV
eukprot:3617370-Prymnesium_polylepis.1